MNSTALAAIVVAVCVICPLGVGFLWPTGEMTEIGYTTEGNMDVTQALNNDTAPVEYAYTSYMNNMFYWLDASTPDSPGYYETGLDYMETTTVPNSYPVADFAEMGDYGYTGDPVNLDGGTWTNYAFLQVFALNGAEFTVGGQHVDCLLLFPGSGVGYGMKGYWSGHYDVIQVPGNKFTVTTITPGQDTMRIYKYTQATDSDGNKLYVEMKDGLQLMDGTVWMNGETNSRATLIVDPYSSSYTITAGDVGSGDTATVYIDNTSGTIMASVNGLDWKSIGSRSVYPKVMIEFDSTDDQVVVTGLMNMDGYSGYTPSKRGNSVSFDVSFGAFKNIQFFNPAGVVGIVYMTSILTDPIEVMNDATLRFADFYPDNLLSMNMKNISMYGDSMSFILDRNGVTETVTLAVQDGFLTNVPFFGEDGDTYEDVSLRNLVVALIPDTDGQSSHVMINGKLADIGTYHGTVQTTDSFEIQFDGIWKAAISIQDVVPYEYSSYTWAVGNFGVSASGFCTIGMLAAVLMTVASALYARSNEMSAVIPLITSIGCAGVYLTMLFSL